MEEFINKLIECYKNKCNNKGDECKDTRDIILLFSKYILMSNQLLLGLYKYIKKYNNKATEIIV